MTSARGPVRSRRRGQVVAVTRAGGPAGAAVVAALEARPGVGRVLGLDSTAAPGSSVVAGALDDPSVADRLQGVDVVVHVAAPTDLAAELELDPQERRLRAVRTMQAVGTAAAAVGAQMLVVVTSAMLLGANADNPPELDDDAPVRAPGDTGLVGDLLEVEQVARRVPQMFPGLSLTLVRPAALVGGVDSVVTRHFEAPVLLTVRGASDAWQFCHVEDLGSAVALVVTSRLEGSLGVGAPGALRQDEVVAASGLRRLDVPTGMAFGAAERLHRLGVLRMPANDLAFVVHPWVVSSAGLREAGWAAGYDNRACLEVLLADVRARQARPGHRVGHPVGRREAVYGAAGAAVAVVGAAALVRQARSKGARRHQ